MVVGLCLNNFRLGSQNVKKLIKIRSLCSKRTSAADSNSKLFDRKMDTNTNLFKGTPDHYNGITIDTNVETVPEDVFSEILKKSLEHWEENNKRTIWFKVDLNQVNFVPILAKNGFTYHHARDRFVMMVKWLPKDEESNLPMYAHTMIGVGGLVTNAKDEILAIREKQSIIPGMWKLPGGYVEPNENFLDAVKREVFEETGINTKFETVVSFRHSRGFNFGCSDVYIVIALKPEGDGNEEIKICEREIAESKWMKFDEFLGSKNVHDLNRDLLKTYLNYKSHGIKFTYEEVLHPILKKKYFMYFVEPKL